MQLTDNDKKVINKFEKYIYENAPSSQFLIKIIELAGDYLNLETISNYAKRTGISYNGAKNNRQTIELFNTKFIIDNE